MEQFSLFDKEPTRNYCIDNYIIADFNRVAYRMIDEWYNLSFPMGMILGDHCSGKSYLAKMWSGKFNAVLFTKDNITDYRHLIHCNNSFVFDDLECFAGHENELFHAYNIIKEQHKNALFTARHDWKNSFNLPDLISRLSMISTVSIDCPDLDILEMLVHKILFDSGIILRLDVSKYIFRRMERSFYSAWKISCKINYLVSICGYNLTLRNVKELFNKDF